MEAEPESGARPAEWELACEPESEQPPADIARQRRTRDRRCGYRCTGTGTPRAKERPGVSIPLAPSRGGAYSTQEGSVISSAVVR
jgi:hypothetical protein